MHRRGFLARLFAAPVVALALLKAPLPTPDPWAVESSVTDEHWYQAFPDDHGTVNVRLPQRWAISRGSVFEYECVEPVMTLDYDIVVPTR